MTKASEKISQDKAILIVKSHGEASQEGCITGRVRDIDRDDSIDKPGVPRLTQ